MYEDIDFYEDRWIDPAEWLDEIEAWADDAYDRERDWEAEA